MQTLRLRLTIEREARGWSKSELGRRSAVNQTTIGAIETGRFKPYRGQMEKLARALAFRDAPERLLDEVPVEPAEPAPAAT